MRPAYLEAHLRRDPPSLHKFQLLWKFYVKNGQPLRAAEVLGAMAESTEYANAFLLRSFDLLVGHRFEVELESRLEYLTLAVANAKSHPISAGGRHETAIAFLSDLEEKLDVAQVQLEIYNTLLPHVNDAPEVGDRIRMLSKQLLTMTDVNVPLSCSLLYNKLLGSCIKNLLFLSIFQLPSYFACTCRSTVTKAS